MLLDHGANPNVQDPQVKYSPLHCAILGYHMNRSDETCDFIESLLEHGANPRIMDRSGETAPHLSIGTLDFRIMSKFVEHLGPEVQVLLKDIEHILFDKNYRHYTIQKKEGYARLKVPAKHFKILPYFIHMKTQNCFFHFSFHANLFFP